VTFDSPLCRDADAVRVVIIHSPRSALRPLDAAVSITAINQVNARTREAARGA